MCMQPRALHWDVDSRHIHHYVCCLTGHSLFQVTSAPSRAICLPAWAVSGRRTSCVMIYIARQMYSEVQAMLHMHI